MSDSKDWYESTTVWGGLVSALSPLVYAVFHFTVSPELATAIATACAGVGGLVAVVGRMRATKPISAPK